MITWPDLTFPPINLYVIAQWHRSGEVVKRRDITRETKAQEIERLMRMRRNG